MIIVVVLLILIHQLVKLLLLMYQLYPPCSHLSLTFFPFPSLSTSLSHSLALFHLLLSFYLSLPLSYLSLPPSLSLSLFLLSLLLSLPLFPSPPFILSLNSFSISTRFIGMTVFYNIAKALGLQNKNIINNNNNNKYIAVQVWSLFPLSLPLSLLLSLSLVLLEVSSCSQFLLHGGIIVSL